jgi:hypothetical protein
MQEIRMLPDCDAFHVLKYEVIRIKLANQAHELLDERVSGVVKSTLADHGEPLAGCTAEHDIDLFFADARRVSNGCSGDVRDRPRDHSTVGKIECMYRGMDWINFDRRDNVKTGLFEPQRHAASARKQIYPNWSHKKASS